ncbi:MAG TPA: hypothetical protein VG294_10560 [Solirubrobacteraceae bacterium]|jgi:hypothetical protein|nr:hypothetical protein [Solirubrobacteraceae bacterium]
MVLTIIIIIVMLVISFGLVALYREVGLGRGEGGGERFDAPPSASSWPLGNLRAGNHFAIPSEDAFTGFVALCADDDDALAEINQAALVADDWGYPFLVAIAKTPRPNGWINRLDALPGNVGQYDMRVDQMRALQPVSLPIVAFVNEGRLLDATTRLDSSSSIITTFQHCRFGLTR